MMHTASNIKVALVWAVAGGLATAAVMPYAFALFPIDSMKVQVPLAIIAAVQVAQSAVLLFLLSWVGLICATRLGLDSPVIRSWLNGQVPDRLPRRAAIAALLGCAVGFLIIAMSAAFDTHMPPSLRPLPQIALWKRLLATPYGGIVEECLCRLFLLSVLAWLLAKVCGRTNQALRGWFAWSVIAISSLLFGIGHLPAVAQIWPITIFVVLRTVMLNTIGGLLFGWLFWHRGFEYSVIAHFCADFVLHGVGSG